MDEFEMPRLAKGAHKRGSGAACAMNAVSYLAGDRVITDKPKAVAEWLRRIAITVNDTICQEQTKVATYETKRVSMPAGALFIADAEVEAMKVTPVDYLDMTAAVVVANEVSFLCDDCSHLMWLAIARLIGTGSTDPGLETRMRLSIDMLRMFLSGDDFLSSGTEHILVATAEAFLGSDDPQITSRFTQCCGEAEAYRRGVIREAIVRIQQIAYFGSAAILRSPIQGAGPEVVDTLDKTIQRCLKTPCRHDRRESQIGYLNTAIDLFEQRTATQHNTVFTYADRQLIVDEGKLVNA